MARLAQIPAGSGGGAPSAGPSQDSGGNHYCLYADGQADSVQLGVGATDKASFDFARQVLPTSENQDVPGVGDEAYFSQTSGILMVLKGDKLVQVWVIHGGNGDPQTALTQAKAIAQAIVPKI